MKTSTEVNDERVRFVNSVTPQSSPYLTKKPSETKEDIELGSVFEHHEPSTFLRRLVIEGHIEKLREYCAIESELEFLDDNGMAVIHYAAKLNRAEIVMLLLDFGANIDARSTDNMTPLHIACKYESEQVVPVLLRRGADPTLKSNHGFTALHFAAQRGNVSIVEILLQNKKVMVNARNVRGHTPLHDACERKRIRVCALLVKYDAAIDAQTDEEMTPIHIAAFNGDVDMLQLLLDKAVEQGRDMRELLEYGDTKSVLLSSIFGGSPETLNLIVQHGVSIKQTKPRTYAALHAAAVFDVPEAIKCLLSSGADTEIRDSSLKTPLHWASSLNRTSAIKILLEAGASLTARDSKGLTPFLTAVRAGHYESSQLLLESGADINATESTSKSCLHLAVEQENFEMVRLLLQHTGMELINMVDSRERTPLHYAALSKNSEILQALIDKGCTCSVADENLKTPLHLAAEHGKLRNAQRLLTACMTLYVRRDELGRLALHYAAMNGRSKICALLLGCPEQVNTLDIDNWSPLLWAAKSGCVECVEMLLSGGASAEYRDSQGNSALHVAVIHGHVKTVLCLLDRKAPILINHEGLNCLDYATENQLYDGVRTMVQHDRWREFFEARGKNSQNLLGKLIEGFPSAAEVVLDNCIERSPNPRACNYTVKYNFRLLDPGPLDVSSKDGTRFFGLSELVQYRREQLIQHPVACKLLDTKWKNFGLPLYFLNSITYLCFVILLTLFMQSQRQNISLLQQGSMRTGADFRVTSSLNSAINKAGLVFVVFHMCKELLQIYLLKQSYFYSFQNLIEWAIYTTGFLFLIAFATNSEVLMATNLPWQCGTTCIFLSYMNLIVQTRLVWYIGLYVTMFIEVFKTLMQVMSMVAMFIIAYAVVFVILFKEQAPFADFGRSIVKTTVMTIGELNYDELLVSNLEGFTNKTGIASPLVPFPIISNIFFYIFMLTMPIVLMNLLVGLAVGDIDAIRKTSNLRRKAAMIEFLKETESRYPAAITQWLYQTEVVDKPNCTVINRWKFLFGGTWKNAFDDEQEYTLNKELKTRYERLDKCVFKTKKRVKSITALLEKQNQMIVALTSKLNLCQVEECEETTKP